MLTTTPSPRASILWRLSSFLSAIILLSCSANAPSVFGTYRIFSEDPSVKQWIVGENTYLKLNTDNTIVYNSTMNGKQRFHFEGSFTLDEKTNKLTRQWKEGKLPNELHIQKIGSDYAIQIGTTTHKKENSESQVKQSSTAQ